MNSQDIYKKIMSKVRARRKELKISQMEISKRINTSQSNYSKYERATIEVTLKQMIEIADILNICLSKLTKK